MTQPSGAKKPARRRAGRKCIECGATLSTYNPAPRCMSHDDPRDDRRQIRHNTRKN